MAPSDSDSAGQAPAPHSTSPITALTVEDVEGIIAQAQAGTGDPVTVGMRIFTSFGDNITVTSDVLRQALAARSLRWSARLKASQKAAAR
jgi:hypothetical protein